MLEDIIAESSTDRMSDDQIREFLSEQGVGVLALADAGVPYALPMSFGYDGDEALYFLFLLFGDETRKETLDEGADRASFPTHCCENCGRSERLFHLFERETSTAQPVSTHSKSGGFCAPARTW